MSNFIPVENREGIQPIAVANPALPSQYQVGQSVFFGQNHPLGTIVRASDTASTLGEGEFIYLKGVASTVVGSLVVYNNVAATTTLAPNTANLGQAVAVAMSACTAGMYGWYQIGGVARIKKTAVKVNPNVNIFLSATAGRVMSTVASGKEIMAARSVNAATVASATSTVLVQISRPFAEGQVI
jgi:hypothetical protein